MNKNALSDFVEYLQKKISSGNEAVDRWVWRSFWFLLFVSLVILTINLLFVNGVSIAAILLDTTEFFMDLFSSGDTTEVIDLLPTDSADLPPVEDTPTPGN